MTANESLNLWFEATYVLIDSFLLHVPIPSLEDNFLLHVPVPNLGLVTLFHSTSRILQQTYPLALKAGGF